MTTRRIKVDYPANYYINEEDNGGWTRYTAFIVLNGKQILLESNWGTYLG
jgi:hypothetical protein